VLNEESASALIGASLRSQRFAVSTVSLQLYMTESATDYAPLQGSPGAPNEGEGVDQPQQPMPNAVYLLRRLIDEGLVNRTVGVSSYPVISGAWKGVNTCAKGGDATNSTAYLDYLLANQNESCFKWPLTLQLNPIPDTNRVTGTSNRSPEAWTATPLEATVSPDNKITFQRIDGPQGSTGHFTYIERGDRAFLVGIWDFLYTGTASRKRFDVKMYSYSFRPDVGETSGQAPAGTYELGTVSNLLLTIETRAVANFTWSVALNALGKVVLEGNSTPTRGPSGTGSADFAKKPDGTWVLVPPLRF
jgi:hypothetical protein